jgi:uncharacterized protein (DUF2267 family)
MNLEIHKPELLERVNAHIQTGHFHDADELIEKALDALDEQATAATGATVGAGASELPAVGRPLSARIREIWADMPDEVSAKLPADGASQHDHYMYGVPKRDL